MGYRIIIFGLLVLLALTVAVEAKSSIDTWVYSGDSVNFQEVDYFFFLNTQNNGVLVQSDDYRQLISLGQCHEHNFIQTCLKEVEMEDFKRIRFDTMGNPFYGMRIEMDVTGPQLTFRTAYNTTRVDINDRITGTLKVENTGNRQAENVRITAQLTPGTIVEYCSDCRIVPSGLVWTLSSLNVDEEREISVRIRAASSDDIITNVSSTYHYRSQEGSSSYTGPVIRLIKPYDIRLNHRRPASVGQTVNSEITLRNVGSHPLSITAVLDRNNLVSYGGTIMNELINDGNTLTLAPGKEEKYTITLRSDHTGNHESSLTFFFRRNDQEYNETLNLRLDVTAADIDMSFSTGKKNVVGGDTDFINLELRNTKDLAYRNIRVNVSGFHTHTSSIESLTPGQSNSVFSQSIFYPTFYEKTEITAKLVIDYETAYRESKRDERDIKVTVYPLGLSYDIDRTINPENPAIGEQFTVTVRGRKLVDSRIDIELITDVLNGAERVSGSTSGPAKFALQYEPLYSYTAVRTSENMSIATDGTVRFGARTAPLGVEYVAPAPPVIEAEEDPIEIIEENGNGAVNDKGIDPKDVSIRERERPRALIDRIAEWFRNLFRRGSD
ncbi:MAG: hypothetical protein ACMXYL_00170 [Candidatus Woesearchaeota archaeon]